MREIKFELWDGVGMSGPFTLEDIARRGFPLFIPKGNVDAIRQFTGLLDKNGVEIYEGDIVDYQTPGSKPWLVAWHESGMKTCWSKLRGGNYVDMGWEPEYVVIGNIYENPDLLEVA